MLYLPGFLHFNQRLNPQKLKAYNKSRAETDKHRWCHAPFKSMLLSPSGDVTVCHYNRGIIIGKYPHKSLSAIWHGKEMLTLRKKILKSDFSWGCHQCYNDLSKERFYSAGCRKYDALPEVSSGYPSLIEFQLSNLCNLECIMCSGEYSSGIRENRELLKNYPSPYDEAFVQQLETFIPHLKKAYFTGGEPFIIPIYKKIWGKMLDINPHIEMNISTNAMLIDKNILEKGKFNLTVSIDTLNPDNYEKIRKHANFEAVKENISYLHGYAQKNKSLLSVKFVLMQQNINDIPALYTHFDKLHVQLYPKMVWLPFKLSLYSYSPQELSFAIATLGTTKTSAETPVQKENAARLSEVIQQLKAWQTHLQKQKFHYSEHAAHSIEALKNNLYQNLIKSLKEASVGRKEKKQLSEQIHALLNDFVSCSSNEAGIKKGLAAFSCLPADVLVFEILRGNNDKLLARFVEDTK